MTKKDWKQIDKNTLSGQCKELKQEIRDIQMKISKILCIDKILNYFQKEK